MSTPSIELVYFSGCPHVDAARVALRSALHAAGLPAQWQEWDQMHPQAPERVQGYGSPTVLVGGVDVTGMTPLHGGRACRADGIPAPSVIAAALAGHREGLSDSRQRDE